MNVYMISGALRSAEPFSYGDEALEARLMECYGETEFGCSSDEAAVQRAEELQRVADSKAQNLLEKVLGDTVALCGGPVYIDHLYRCDGDVITKIQA